MKLPPNAITTNNLDEALTSCGVYLLMVGHYMWTLHVDAFFIFVSDFGTTYERFFIFVNVFPEHGNVVHPD